MHGTSLLERFTRTCVAVSVLALSASVALSQVNPPAGQQAPAAQVPAGTAAGQVGQPGAITDPNYVLGPDDLVTLAVIKHPEFSGDFLVPPSGIVDLPVVGRLQLAGRTVEAVSADIMIALKKRLLRPEFTLTIKLPRVRRVYALGDLKLPGFYDFRPGWRISELVAAAGGLAVALVGNGVQSTSLQMYDCTVTVVSPGEHPLIRQVNLGDALTGVESANLPLAPGDTVTVASVRLLSVYVIGKVNIPGLKLLRADNAGILEVIAMSGGTTVDAVSSAVEIRHLDKTVDVVNLVPYLFQHDTDKSSLPAIRQGDVIEVPESLQKVAVLGMVKLAGVFPLEDGRPVTLADAISLAQGPMPRARLSRVGLMRVDPVTKKGIHYTINFGDYLRKGDARLNPLLRPGDIVYVPETNSIDWGIILASLGTFSNAYYNYQQVHQ